jgi:hypothetical protein
MKKLLGAYNVTGADLGPTLPIQDVQQEFYSPLGNLSVVEVNIARTPILETELTMILRDAETGEVMAKDTALVNAEHLNNFVTFNFPAHAGSAGKKYLITFQSNKMDELDVATGFDVSQQFQVKVSHQNYYQNGQLTIDGQAINGDLVFRTYHQSSLRIREVFLSSVEGRFKADPGFALIFGLMICSLLLVVGVGLVKAFIPKKSFSLRKFRK